MKIILDLDGTLYDTKHRDHLAQAKQWDEFHSLLHEDKPKPAVFKIIHSLMTAYDLEIIALTARPEKWRKKTLDKFEKDEISLLIDHLIMRPDDNFMKSPDFKQQAIENFCKVEEIFLAIEDRDDVIERFISMGIEVIKVHS